MFTKLCSLVFIYFISIIFWSYWSPPEQRTKMIRLGHLHHYYGGWGSLFLWIQNLYLWDPPSQICFQSATPNHSMSTTVIRPCWYQTSQTTCLMNVKLLNCICCWLYTCHYYILWNTMQHTEWYIPQYESIVQHFNMTTYISGVCYYSYDNVSILCFVPTNGCFK